MKRRLPGRLKQTSSSSSSSGLLPALTTRGTKRKKGPMSREEISSRWKAIITGSPDPVKVEDTYEPTIYEGEDDE